MYRKMIQYDRKTGDFAMYINGDLIGYAATYLQAETTLNKLVYELLTKSPVSFTGQGSSTSDCASPEA